MPRLVVIVVFDDVQLLDVSGPADVFDAANRLAGRPVYRVRLASRGGGPVRASNGVRISADLDLDDPHDGLDTLLVAGGWGTDNAVGDDGLAHAVRAASAKARRVVSVCTGAFVLAEGGLLEGRRATTHWSRTADLAAFTGVVVEADRLFCHDGRISTSAGVTSGIDLTLSLVEDDLGPRVAREAARWLVMFMRRPGGQSQFSQRLRVPGAVSNPVRAALDAVTADPAGDHRVEMVAARVGLSRRHLARRFRAETGMTPGEYVESVRLEAAQTLLESSAATLATVAARSGFGTAEALRLAFRRRLGVTPGEYRARFGDVAPPRGQPGSSAVARSARDSTKNAPRAAATDANTTTE